MRTLGDCGVAVGTVASDTKGKIGWVGRKPRRDSNSVTNYMLVEDRRTPRLLVSGNDLHFVGLLKGLNEIYLHT